MKRADAWKILTEYIKAEALRRHALCVEACMRRYASHAQDADIEQWGLAGLLHDFDYETWPEPPDHTRKGAEILRKAGCPDEVVGAILSHVPWNQSDYPRDRPIRKTLFACDELAGFIYAVALVRSDGINGMKPKSVKKKLKQKSFAAAVSREDIDQGAELLGLPIDEHIANCIEAIQGIAPEVGLKDQPGG